LGRQCVRGVGFTDVERPAFDPALDYHNAVRSLFVRAARPFAAVTTAES